MSTLYAALFDGLTVIVLIIGTGAILFSMFQPLIKGMTRATMLYAQAKTSPEQIRKTNDAKMLRQMADSVDTLEPTFAAELRAIAARA